MTLNNIPLYRNRNLEIIYSITLMAVLGVASITPAFPKVAKHFDISGESIGLLIIFFTLPGVILAPFLGVAADRIGRKTVLVPSLLIFAIAGFLCSLAESFELLLFFRLLQGIGASSLGSLNVTLIGDLFEGKERAAAMGYNASILSIATASYPFVGGVLASIEWHYVFYLPLLALPIALLVLYRLENLEINNKQNFKLYFKSTFSSVKSKHALILFAASIVTFIILYGSFLTYIPVLLDTNFSAKPFLIGLVMSVMSLTTAIVSSKLGRLSSIIEQRKILIISFGFYGVSLFLIPMVNNFWLLMIPIIFYGIGHGLNIPTIQSLLTGIAPVQYRGAFMAMNGMVLRLGQTLGPIIMGFFFIIGSLLFVFWSGTVLAFIMISILLIYNASVNRSR